MTKVFSAEDVRRLSQEPDPKVDKWIEESLVEKFRKASNAGIKYVWLLNWDSKFEMEYLKLELERRGFIVDAKYEGFDCPPKELKVYFPAVEE